MTVDPKPSAKKFVLKNFDPKVGPCHFDSIENLLNMPAIHCHCARHDRQCQVPGFGPADVQDVLVAGFPCAPYSGARPKRHSEKRLHGEKY
eukprot:967439-Amphidinium_carterae.1